MKNALIELIDGEEGPCLSIGDESSGHRLSGPKPWGGGHVIHSFPINLDELIREAQALRRQEDE